MDRPSQAQVGAVKGGIGFINGLMGYKDPEEAAALKQKYLAAKAPASDGWRQKNLEFKEKQLAQKTANDAAKLNKRPADGGKGVPLKFDANSTNGRALEAFWKAANGGKPTDFGDLDPAQIAAGNQAAANVRRDAARATNAANIQRGYTDRQYMAEEAPGDFITKNKEALETKWFDGISDEPEVWGPNPKWGDMLDTPNTLDTLTTPKAPRPTPGAVPLPGAKKETAAERVARLNL